MLTLSELTWCYVCYTLCQFKYAIREIPHFVSFPRSGTESLAELSIWTQTAYGFTIQKGNQHWIFEKFVFCPLLEWMRVPKKKNPIRAQCFWSLLALFDLPFDRKNVFVIEIEVLTIWLQFSPLFFCLFLATIGTRTMVHKRVMVMIMTIAIAIWLQQLRQPRQQYVLQVI